MNDHDCNRVRAVERIDDKPMVFNRWQCICGMVWELHGETWRAIFMAPESLRRPGWERSHV